MSKKYKIHLKKNNIVILFKHIKFCYNFVNRNTAV